MVFSSTVFLFLFLPITLLLYFNPLCKKREYRNIVLLIMSLGFYGWGEPVFIFIMLALIVVDWYAALFIEKSQDCCKKKIALFCTTVLHLSVFFIFKYLTFVCQNINYLLKTDKITISVALPIGISFFTFQMLSYLFDVYGENVKAQRKLTHVAVYVSMFPQLVAGPIVRYNTVAAEIEERHENIQEFVAGFSRFIIGLSKKVLLANYFGIITDNIFAMYQEGTISVVLAWIGAIAYTLQIYFDFSAYSDMAIGLGQVFGFHFNENFNYPYIASSITDFWRRWHISLSTWFRDYIYIPLGGNRVSKWKHIRNIFVVWLLTGIWHGANWTFIVWGLIYFVFLMLEKYTSFIKHIGRLSHLYTLVVVILAWVIFRADSLSQAIGYIGTMFGVHADGIWGDTVIQYLEQGKWLFLAGIVFSTPYYKKIKKIFMKKPLLWQVIQAICIFILFMLSVACLLKSTYNPFIYFNF